MRLGLVNLTGGRFSGGYAKYLRAVVPRLAADDRLKELHVFSPPGTSQVIPAAVPVHEWSNQDAALGFPALRRDLMHRGLDVLFIPTARWLDVAPIPVVVMVRNMEPLVRPFVRNPFPEYLRNVMRARAARLACDRATRVIAVSRFVRSFLETRWGIESNKVTVIHHGVERVLPNAHSPSATPRETPQGFIFSAGSIRPSRGLEDLILALAVLRARGLRKQLFIAGDVEQVMRSYRTRLERLAERTEVADQVVWMGSLKEEEMSWCYSRCEVFAATSRVEACPNTVLEAMSHGCAIIATRDTAISEVLGDAGWYYPPRDPHALAEKLLSFHQSPERLEALGEAAKARARDFDWDVTADKTVRSLADAMVRNS